MVDPADVVPLRRRPGREFPDPAACFADAVDPGRTLGVTWSADHAAVQLSIGCSDGAPQAVVITADHVLDLVRTLVEGLPAVGAGCPRPPATVLPLHPRPTK